MQIVSIEDSFHEMSKSISGKIRKKYFNLLSVEKKAIQNCYKQPFEVCFFFVFFREKRLDISCEWSGLKKLWLDISVECQNFFLGEINRILFIYIEIFECVCCSWLFEEVHTRYIFVLK